MRFEKTAAGVLVRGVGVELVQELDALVQARALRRVLDGEQEQVHVRVQRELVHGIDRGEVVQHEVQNRRAHRARPVERRRRLDFFSRLLGDGEGFRHLVGRHLGVVERVDELDVVQQRARGVGEQIQKLVLQLGDGALAGGDFLHQVVLLPVEIGALLLYDDVEQLRLQSLFLHREVYDGHLRAHLGGVVRVVQLRGEVQLEVGRVVHLLVAELDRQRVAFLDEGLAQHGLEDGVDLLLHVLNEHGVAELDGVLHAAHHVRHVQSHHLQTVRLLHVLDPLVALALRVDQKRPPVPARHHHAVLRGEGVRG